MSVVMKHVVLTD